MSDAPKPLDPDESPDASTRIAIDPEARSSIRAPRAKSRSWSAMLREAWAATPAPPAPIDPTKPR